MYKTLMATKIFTILLFIYLFSTSKAQSPQSNNISIGSILYTNSAPNFWPSPSGHFAFGFYPIDNGFKVGIWLVGSQTRTVVWTARPRDHVVSSGAALLFSADRRQLLLHDSNGGVWLIAEAVHSAVVASMLDSGNFVLYGSNFEIVWASFDYPSDTLLVGQKLAQNTALFSSISITNQSIGNFKLSMQSDGNLIAFPVRSIQEGRYGYWSSYTSSAGKNVSVNLNQDGLLYLANSTGFIIKNLTQGGLSVNKTTLYKATLDVDGIFRLYQHQIATNGSLSSKILWVAIEREDRCVVKGTCGLNSYCSPNDDDIACLCPPGFVYVDPKQPQDGCKSNSSIENACVESKSNYIISTLENTYWERDEYDIANYESKDACAEACLEDCNCVVAKFRDQLCLKYKLPLRFGIKNFTSPSKALIKVKIGSLPKNDQIINKMTKKIGKEFVVVGVDLIAISLIVFMLTVYLVYAHQRWGYKIISRLEKSPDVVEDINLRSFTYEQLVSATENFKEEIGRGASGRVYKGSLAVTNKEIAVKRLIKRVEDGESEFRNEMEIIGRTHHKNLVRLIGFCSEGSNRLLVYEFMKNGSMGNLLFNAPNRASWSERKRIALEIAKGLQYLHEECETRIIHCDIKPHNILMDKSWTAKISDFGLSKLLKPDQTRTYTTARGTRGYAAPEWHNNNSPITVKADVYSYGVMLLEIICCRKNVDGTLKDEEIILIDWAYHCYEAGEIQKLVNGENIDIDELEKMVKIGIWCVETELTWRPTMKDVILMMEGIVVTPPPPSPYSSGN